MQRTISSIIPAILKRAQRFGQRASAQCFSASTAPEASTDEQQVRGCLELCFTSSSHQFRCDKCMANAPGRYLIPHGSESLSQTCTLFDAQQASTSGRCALIPVLKWFSASGGVASALTLPSSWYTEPRAADLEREGVWRRSWLLAGHRDQLKAPGDFVTGKCVDLKFVVCRGEDGTLRAFHNVRCAAPLFLRWPWAHGTLACAALPNAVLWNAV